MIDNDYIEKSKIWYLGLTTFDDLNVNDKTYCRPYRAYL